MGTSEAVLRLVVRDPSANSGSDDSDAPFTITGTTCAADLTMDGNVDFGDVSAFLDAFAAMDLAADFSPDRMIDFADVSAFLDAFAQGCP